MKHTTHRLAAAAACLLAAAPSFAQNTQNTALPEVVVSAMGVTGISQPLTDVLADFTLIDAEQIAASGPATLADVLSHQAGLEMVRNGGPGTSTSVFMRGAESRFTAVYVDGVRMDLQIGGAPWKALPLAQVERIEIMSLL